MTPQSLPVPSQIIALANTRRLGRPPRAKEKKENPRIVRIKELAAILNLTPSRIHQLVQEGLPKTRRAKYDRDECAGFYIRYLQALVEKRANLEDGGKIFAGEREERLRLLRANADLREIELARERADLVAIDEVEREMADLIRTSKARVMSIAPRLASELLGETSRVMIHANIESALKEAMLFLAHREVRATDRNRRTA